MTLALRLGRTLGEVLDGMDTYEISLWREFDRLSPLGDERLDLLHAALAATVAQTAGAKVQPLDMLIRWGGEGTPESAEDAGESALKAFLLSKAKEAAS
ncbi:phage tail protein [Achromobacter sp. HNDS-1]|uniref:Phage tail protein n=1 Tax=Achromobacter sp. HNDS-1 TaxID=3151598 RepID=A0AAU7LGX0_9BURK